ncbi:MAG: prolipoprotein diacylglyceryl transferase [Planctomycetes bacterium]|nr:prolipoprotein diacylglyceryl transferase [Planctomycetota bacterium]
MLPKLFTIPGVNLPINSYGFMIMIGFLLGTWISSRRGKTLGLNPDIVLDVAIIAMIFGIIGSKINYVLQYPMKPLDPPKAGVFDFFGSGAGYHPLGGLILGPIPYLFWWWRARGNEKIELYSWKNGVLLGLTLLFAFVGCRAWYLWQQHEAYDWRVFEDWQAGFVWYGGLALGVPAGTLYAKMRGQPIAQVSDVTAPNIMLGLGFGRIGCFLNGCCYGAVTKFFLAIRYPQHPRYSLFSGEYPADAKKPFCQPWSDQVQARLIQDDATHTLPMHPAQLYETVACFAMYFLLSWFWKKKQKNHGETILLMVIVYGAWRFFVEYLRSDPGREVFGLLGFTYSQTLALASVIVCAIWFYFVRTKPQPAAPAAPAAPEKK